MGFNSAFKGLIHNYFKLQDLLNKCKVRDTEFKILFVTSEQNGAPYEILVNI